MAEKQVSEGDIVNVTYTNTTTEKRVSFKADVTDPDDDYINEGAEEPVGFRCRRHSDSKEMGVVFNGWVCIFGVQQKFIGEDADVEVLLPA